MSSSINDVAERAGVSVATVSRALRGQPNVAPETRARVVKAAQDLHYVASPSASRLAARRTSTVGLVLPSLGSWYGGRILAGIHGVFETTAYDVLLLPVPDVHARERFVESQPFRKRVDALLVVDLVLTDHELGRLASGGTPVVTVGFSAPSCSAVLVEDEGAARAATRHLVSLGHERIAILGPPAEAEDAATWVLGRRNGYERTLAEHGLVPDPALDVSCETTALAGAEAMAELVTREPLPTAVFCLTDEIAIGALRAARDAGIAVPEQLSVVGFDGHDLAEFVGLTTVTRDVRGLGEKAALGVLRHLADQDTAPEVIVEPSRLVVRHTTGKPGVAA